MIKNNRNSKNSLNITSVTHEGTYTSGVKVTFSNDEVNVLVEDASMIRGLIGDAVKGFNEGNVVPNFVLSPSFREIPDQVMISMLHKVMGLCNMLDKLRNTADTDDIRSNLYTPIQRDSD